MGGGLHDFSTFGDVYMRFYEGIYLYTCEAIVTTQRGRAIHPLDLTKFESSTSLSTNMPSLVPVRIVNAAVAATAALHLDIIHWMK
jgi:hypothetical protein